MSAPYMSGQWLIGTLQGVPSEQRMAFRRDRIVGLGEYPLDALGRGVAIRLTESRGVEAFRIDGEFDHVAVLLGITVRES